MLTPSNTITPRHLPFSKFIPILIGAGLGLLLRVLVFSGNPGSRTSAMAAGFIWISPFVMGATTVYLAERQGRRSISYYLLAPMASTALMVLGSLAVFVEGLICAILIVPVFSVMGSIGGLLMGLLCRVLNWPRTATLQGLLLLPLLMAGLGGDDPGPVRLGTVERSLLIQASPAQVWALINHITDIRPDEMAHAWTNHIGVPRPLAATTVMQGSQAVRQVRWDKGVHFDEVVQQWEPERHLRWTFRFAPDSVPAGALDDHVRIGGAYFDLNDAAYTLTPEGSAVRLHLRISYRVSTDFNLYANALAQLLIGDFADNVLGLLQHRAEAADQAETAPQHRYARLP